MNAVATRLKNQVALGKVPVRASQELEKLPTHGNKIRTALDAWL
jgi:hypothetical protein